MLFLFLSLGFLILLKKGKIESDKNGAKKS